MDQSWLADELAELDQAERFIHDTMSDFLPTSSGTKNTTEISRTSYKPMPSQQEVTRAASKGSESEVDNLTNQLLNGLDTGKKKDSDINEFHLPPPPDLDDFIYNNKPSGGLVSDLPSPPPTSQLPPPIPPLPKSEVSVPVMSKPAPPPVLPKPSRSTALKGGQKKYTNTVTFKPSRPVSDASLPPPVPPLPVDDDMPPPPAAATYAAVNKEPGAPPTNGGIIIPPLILNERPEPPASKANAEDQLDYLTNTLLANMDNPKDEDFYGFCEKCNRVVEGEKQGCNAMDAIYHITCFTCETCRKQLHGEQFYAVGKKAYCEPCYINSLERCTACQETITDRILRATGKPYHPQCFACVACNKSMDGIPFTLDDDGNIFCVDDYHKKYAPRCTICTDPIMPEPGKDETVRIVALGRSFHVGCYKCEKCGVNLASEKGEGKGCYPLDDHIYCLDCNTSLAQKAA